MLEKPEKEEVAAGGGAGFGAEGWERLKAEESGGEATVWGGGGAGAEGMERSRRSFMPEEEAGFAGAGDEKAEKLPKGLVVRFCVWVWVAGGDLGVESKKLPPPPKRLEEAGGDLVLEKVSRPAKGEGFGAGGAAWLKERPLKASFRPPKPDCCGDC